MSSGMSPRFTNRDRRLLPTAVAEIVALDLMAERQW
jgi:hypothetical protein